MKEIRFLANTKQKSIENGVTTWSSPSNIALVKYWGKRKEQIPENTSISFTLNQCKTITNLTYTKKEDNLNFSFDVFLDGEKQDDFKPKIEVFFNRITPYLSFLKDFHFKIETKNTFPHSSGIASSASGMSALAACLMSIDKELNPEMNSQFILQKTSFLARLGSGSACRSLEGDLVVWGEHKSIVNSSNLFGVKFPFNTHNNFKNYQDTILLVDKGEKQVSSTIGHNLMHNHPFSQQRFVQANQNLEKITAILQNGNLDEFISLVESEALTLHAMMMSSMPYFILMKPNTLEIINKIWVFRKATNSKVCFTLDAGANVHVLYPESEKDSVLQFIKNELVVYCQNGHYICDNIGKGLEQL